MEKNHEEPKNEKYPRKTYTFDVSKCEEIFDLLVADGIILVPKNLKLPALEQRNKRGFCKFHGFLGHNLSRCTCFRDFVQKALDEGRLKFGDKSIQPMQVDADPLKKVDSMYVDVADINMVEISEEIVAGNFVETSMLKEKLQIDAEMVIEDHQSNNAMVTKDQFAEKMKVAYPRAGEDLIDFLKRCKISNIETMLCHRCSSVFDKEAAKSVDGFQPQSKRKGKWVDNRPKFGFNKRGISYKMTYANGNSNRNQTKTFKPPAKSPTNTWVFFGGKKSGYSAPPTKWIKIIGTTPNKKEASNSKKYAYNNNYKGKHPMTKTQWHRYQRQKKARALKDVTNTGKDKGKQVVIFEMAEMLVDSTIGFESLSMLNGYSGYNQIFIAEEDVSKTAFRCPGALGCYAWLVMPIGLKNVGAMYQRAMNSMFHVFIEKFM